MPSINPVENFNFGIFGLNEVRTSIVTAVPTAVGVGTTTNINSTVFVDVTNWSQDSSHGWFGGGKIPAAVSTVDRIDFSNDTGTANIRGPLSSARYDLTATGNSNYGWFGGEFPLKSTVDRIDFSNDSSTASIKGPLSAGRYRLAATGNSNYGWFGGGYNFNFVPSFLSTVDRIDFSNDSSTASVRGPLSLARRDLASTGNSNYGWFGGGKIPAAVSTVDRIDFSNDSATATVRGPLSAIRYRLAATGNSNYGWFGGGTSVPGPTPFSTVDRIDFSNDSSTASVRGPLSSARYGLAATGNSNYGWFGGGSPNVGSLSTVDRIDFSNDSSTASVRGPLSLARNSVAATSGQAKSSSIRPLKGGNFGWFGGGATPGSTFSTVDRIDFSNDSATATVRGPLSLARYRLAATGNSNYGWFGGGIPGPVSTVDRIDFSNDSSTASVRGPLTAAKYAPGATGNSNYGWFGGGFSTSVYISRVDRINFSNDSSRASVRGPLSSAKYKLAATGNSNYGWFGGGFFAPPSTLISTVDRIDFSNDSSTASVRGSLSLVRPSSAATGNSNYGWFGGAFSISTVDRIDFSNDSSTASVRGPLSSVRENLAATGNSNYGWFGGGAVPAPSLVSGVDRIDFSNDSATASVRGPLSLARRDFRATSNTPVG